MQKGPDILEEQRNFEISPNYMELQPKIYSFDNLKSK